MKKCMLVSLPEKQVRYWILLPKIYCFYFLEELKHICVKHEKQKFSIPVCTTITKIVFPASSVLNKTTTVMQQKANHVWFQLRTNLHVQKKLLAVTSHIFVACNLHKFLIGNNVNRHMRFTDKWCLPIYAPLKCCARKKCSKTQVVSSTTTKGNGGSEIGKQAARQSVTL